MHSRAAAFSAAAFSTAAASWLGFVFVTHKGQLSGPWVFIAFLFVAFLLSAAWFGYGLISPFEQKIEITQNSLRWSNGRSPRVKREIALSAIKSLILHTDTDGLATKIIITLNPDEVVRIPFAHVLRNKSELFVKLLKENNPNLHASVA